MKKVWLLVLLLLCLCAVGAAEEEGNPALCKDCNETVADAAAEYSISYQILNNKVHCRLCALCGKQYAVEKHWGSTISPNAQNYQQHILEGCPCGTVVIENHTPDAEGNCKVCAYPVPTCSICETPEDFDHWFIEKRGDVDYHVRGCVHGGIFGLYAGEHKVECLEGYVSLGAEGHALLCWCGELASDVVPHADAIYMGHWQMEGHVRSCSQCRIIGSLAAEEPHVPGDSVTMCYNEDGSQRYGYHATACALCDTVIHGTEVPCTSDGVYRGYFDGREGHAASCTVCGDLISDLEPHNYDTYSFWNLESHRPMCSACGLSKQTEEPHQGSGVFEYWDVETCREICTDCGEGFNYTLHEYDPATITRRGNYHTGLCIRCGGEMGYDAQFDVSLTSYISAGDERTHIVSCSCGLCTEEDSYAAPHGNASCLTPDTCGDCGQTGLLIWKDEIVHNLSEWQVEGDMHYQQCLDCGGRFNEGSHARSCLPADAACVSCGLPYTGENIHHEVFIDAEPDAEGHWLTCECGQVREFYYEHSVSCTEEEPVCYCGFPCTDKEPLHAIYIGTTVVEFDDTEHWYTCARCQTEQREAHYTGCGIGRGAGKCDACGWVIPEDQVSHSELIWDGNETEHWAICSWCRVLMERSAHVPDESDSSQCGLCGLPIS